MALLGYYAVATDDNETYDVEFKIPINCNYTVTTSGKYKYINIALNAGQTIPSTTFNTFTESITTLDGILNLHFKQTQDGATAIRPKVTLIA